MLANLGAYLEFPDGWNSFKDGLDEHIREALTVHVPATPDSPGKTYYMWNIPYSGIVRIQRGFLPYLRSAGIEVNIYQDKRIDDNPFFLSPECRMDMRPHQEEQVESIMRGEQGIIVAPPGAGKTIAVLEAVRRLQRRSLIIVDKINIAQQWQQAWKDLTDGFAPIISGETKYSIEEDEYFVMIITQQSLAKLTGFQIEKLPFGFVCLDECHHVSAPTFTKTLGSFGARFRIGCSATPTRADGLEKISQLVLGPILHRAEYTGFTPSVERVFTGFDYPFWGTHGVTSDQICQLPKCKKNGLKHSHRNNYASVIKELVEDKRRNILIASKIVSNTHKTNLVVSDRLGHLDTLRNLCAGYLTHESYMLTGREKGSERERIRELAAQGPCTIFSTIAKEALDIPRLDRLYLTWPTRKEHLLEQQIGRITRTHPDKVDAVVYDFVDDCSVLESQAYDRLRFYKSKNYLVKGSL